MRHYHDNEIPFETLPTQDKRYTHLWIGIVRRYDQDNEICDVEWLTYPGVRPSTQIPLGMGGPRAYLGGPPEEGSLVACHWLPHLPTGNFKPIIVAYLPSGFIRGRKFELSQTARNQQEEDEDRRRGTRHKMPKLYSGDLAMVSSAGSHVIVDENLHIAAAGLLEMFFRSADLAIISTSLQRYIDVADSRLRWGMVERTFLQEEGDPLSEDGQVHRYVTNGEDATRLEEGGAAWVEHRLQVREVSQGNIPIPETRFKGETTRAGNWLVESVLGTLVGDETLDSTRYGKPLVRIVVSGGAISRRYDPTADATEETEAASAVYVSVKPGDTMVPVASVDIDKSGRMALSLGKTLGTHPAGADKSLQIAADGSFEAVFGAGSGVAWDLTVSGDYENDVEGTYTLTSTGTMDLAAVGNATFTTDGTLDLLATGNATLDGALVYLGAAGGTAGAGRPF